MNNNINNIKNIAYLRREYKRGRLRRKNLPNNPLLLFEEWLQETCIAQLPDSTAMIIATVDSSGQPYQRTVLLKNYDKQGMVFYTNLSSRKALQLKNNPRVSLHFPWHFLERQVIILGKVEKLSQLEVLEYFHSRPRNSQISAWASKQSSIISSYSLLEEKFFTFEHKFQHSEVPLPNFWGGFRVKYYSIEFWQGGPNRMHDRFLYQLNENGDWLINRLAP